MQSKELLKHLQTTYPKLDFNLEAATDVGILDMCSHEEMKDMPQNVITCVFGGICIWDVHCSECSRFVESPTYYGISEEDGKLILEHNKVSIHGVYDEIMNAQKEPVDLKMEQVKAIKSIKLK